MINPRKALIIQLRRIGDVLMCTPSIRAFKKRYPDCELDFLTELPDVLQNNPHIDYIRSVDHSREFNFSYQFNLIRGIRAAHYDLIVDFYATARSAYYSFLSGAGTRLSYGYGHRRWAYNLVPNKDDRAIYAAADRLNLLAAIDVPPDGLELNFYLSDADRENALFFLGRFRKPIITISPVSRREHRRWPLDKYSALCDRISAHFDCAIVILAGPGEGEFARKVAAKTKAATETAFVSKLGLLGAILGKSCLHIGNDNGPKHIAVACGAPTLTIFGPDNPIAWTYPDSSRHQYLAPARSGNNCIKDISVDDVWEKVSAMLGASPGVLSLK